MPALILKAGREKSLLRRHPWIFSGAIEHVDDEPVSGGTVDLLSSNKQFLARASYSPTSQIRARVWTFEDEPVDADFFQQKDSFCNRRTSKIERSRRCPEPSKGQSNAYRLIYAESDGIPRFDR